MWRCLVLDRSATGARAGVAADERSGPRLEWRGCVGGCDQAGSGGVCWIDLHIDGFGCDVVLNSPTLNDRPISGGLLFVARWPNW